MGGLNQLIVFNKRKKTSMEHFLEGRKKKALGSYIISHEIYLLTTCYFFILVNV